MAFQTSNELFDHIFNTGTEEKQSGQALEKLMKYLNDSSSPLAQRMGEYLENGEKLSAFLCREDLFSDVAEELYEKDIPCAAVTEAYGNCGFLIREADRENAEKACDEVRKRKSRFCTVMSGQRMMKLAASGQDKRCIALHGLSAGYAEMIREKFSISFDNAKIGLDLMQDGTVTVTLPARDCIKRNVRKGADLCSVYLETLLAATGPNAAKNLSYAQMRADLRKKLSEEFKDGVFKRNKMPLWIVGRGTQFLTISFGGFSYGRASVSGNTVELGILYQADSFQPDYKQELVSYVQRIPFPVLTYSRSEVLEHFRLQSDGSGELDTLDTSPDGKYRVWARGEKKMAGQIDRMITRKIQNDPVMVMDGREDEKFLHYMQTAGEFLTALAAGHVPAGYEIEDERVLFDIMEKHKIDGEMYEGSIPILQDIEAVILSTTIERIADVAERIEAERRDTGEHEKKNDRGERSGRTRSRMRTGMEKE